MKQASTRVVVRLFVLFAVHVSYFALSAQAQDLFMRRSNSLGHWTAYMTNNGALFTQSDIFSLTVTPGGALWQNGGSVSDTVIYGAGLWIGGLRRRNGVLMPHTEYSYNPNDGHSIFVPGSIIYDGGPIDSSQQARDKYRLYRSTDLVGPAWPLRIVNGQPAYIDSVPLRTTAGPPSTLGDEDLFTIYKDSDPTAIYDTLVDPFSLEVRSRISFWDHGLLKDVAIVQNEIIYTGEDTVFNPVVAMVVDGDINYPGDDRTKGVQNEGIQATVFFTDQSSTDPLLGAMVLEAQHGPNRPNAGVTSLRYWNILDDPITDSDRYAFLTEVHHDTALSGVGDARMILSSLSHVPLVHGDTVFFNYAFFVRPTTGPALSPADSGAMLNEARTIYSHFLAGNLYQLPVHEGPQANSNIVVYPNPASNRLFIQNPGDRVEIFNVLGQRIADEIIKNGEGEINVASLPAGLYFVRSLNQCVPLNIIH